MSIFIKYRIKIYKKLGDNTWDSTGEILTEAVTQDVSLGMGQIKDTFKFRITNTDNNIFKTFFNGNGSTTIFNLDHFPIPLSLQTDTTRFLVLVDSVVVTAWTIDNSAGTITFTTAPASGTNNIEIQFPVIEVDDRLTVEQWKDAANPAAADLLIDGIVTTPPQEIGDMGRIMIVNGASWIESLFATLIPIDVQGTSAEIIGGSQVSSGKSGALDLLAFGNPSRQVFWHKDNHIDKDGNTISQGVGSNPFPSKHYVQNFKAVNEIIEEASANDFTENGPYFITVVTENDAAGNAVIFLKWLPKGTATNHTITEGLTPTNIKIDKKGDEIINAIIFTLGKDAYEISRHDVNWDAISIGKFGQKWKFITSTGFILNDLMQAEIATDADKDNFNYDASGNPIDWFPLSYNYTIRNFTERDDNTGNNIFTLLNGALTSSATTVTVDSTTNFSSSGSLKIEDEFMTYSGKTATTFTGVTRGTDESTAVAHIDNSTVLEAIVTTSDATYNESIRKEGKWVGKQQTQKILDKLANPRFFVNVEFPFTTEFTIGNVVALTVPSYLFTGKKLRITQIKYTSMKTILSLEEDEKTIGVV